MIRLLGVLLVSTALLTGCALVDDVRREFGGEPERRADPSPTAPSGWTPPSPSPSSPPPSPSTPSLSPDGCPPSGVLVRTGEVNAAMGVRAMGLELVNCGTVPFTVNGYPEVRLLDDDRRPLPVTVGRGSSGISTIDSYDVPPAPVTAAPGERLVAGLVWRNKVADMTTDPVNGTYLEVVPAPGQPPQVVRPTGGIDLGTTGRLGVAPWRAAAR